MMMMMMMMMMTTTTTTTTTTTHYLPTKNYIVYESQALKSHDTTNEQNKKLKKI